MPPPKQLSQHQIPCSAVGPFYQNSRDFVSACTGFSKNCHASFVSRGIFFWQVWLKLGNLTVSQKPRTRPSQPLWAQCHGRPQMSLQCFQPMVPSCLCRLPPFQPTWHRAGGRPSPLGSTARTKTSSFRKRAWEIFRVPCMVLGYS